MTSTASTIDRNSFVEKMEKHRVAVLARYHVKRQAFITSCIGNEIPLPKRGRPRKIVDTSAIPIVPVVVKPARKIGRPRLPQEEIERRLSLKS